MERDQWLVGWRDIGNYIKKSAKTAQRYAKDGMPFFRDPGGRPIAKPSMIDDYIVGLNQDQYEYKVWKDKGIKTALAYEDYDEKQRKEYEEKIILAQKPPRGMF